MNNTIKTHPGNRNKITITKWVDGRPQKTIYKGITLDNIPSEYTKWFTYKGLTFIIA
tara:strand:- start:204 stop:374 length:171 start_codon:yes stop_codon:yes gene_type:complete